MTTPAPLLSPRLAALQQELEIGNSAALDIFWQGVTDGRRTPLTETINSDETHSLVTFLCRPTTGITEVGIASGLSGNGYLSEPMARLLQTDLWYKTYRVRNDVRMTYCLMLNGAEQADPCNPIPRVYPMDEDNFWGKERNCSVLSLPAAPAQPWIAIRPGVPGGQVVVHHLRSNILGNERRIWVYTPSAYEATGHAYPTLTLFDGWAYTQCIPAATILDNLIAEGAVPPMIAIMISALKPEIRSRELGCYPQLVDFLVEELMPWLHQHYQVSSDPNETIIAGSSLAGMAAAYVGLQRSEIFGNVLSQSGSFFWKPANEIEYEWLTRQYVTGPRLPLQFYLEAGLLEKGGPGGDRPSLLLANRHVRDVLQAKGYEVHYAEFSGGHDDVCWQGSLADGLIALVGKNRAPNTS